MYRKQRTLIIIAASISVLFMGTMAQAESLPLSDNISLWLTAEAGVSQSGGVVSSWADQAALGGSNDAVQGDPAWQPALVPNASPMGDRPVIRFDGSDRLAIAANTVFESDTRSWFCVYNAAPGTASQNVLVAADNLSSSYWGTKAIANATETTRAHSVWTRNSSASYKSLTSETVPVSSFVMVSAVVNGTSGYVNSIKPDTLYGVLKPASTSYMPGTPKYGTTGSSQGNLGLAVGALPTYDHQNLTGDICEIIVYDICLSHAQRAIVDDYLYDKWFSPVPEPSSIALFISAVLFGAFAFARKFR